MKPFRLTAAHLNPIPKDQLNSFSVFIPRDEMPEVIAGKEMAVGIYDDLETPVGALVTARGTEPDGGPGEILVVKNIYVIFHSNISERLELIVEDVIKMAAGGGLKGVVWQVLHPENEELEKILQAKFSPIQDGNTIYETKVGSFLHSPVMKKDFTELYKQIMSIEDMPVKDRSTFFNDMGVHYPAGLTPDSLPGKFLRNLSFVYQKEGVVYAYILTSEISKELLYVGAVYAEGNSGIIAVALIRYLIKAAMETMYYDNVMFAAASDKGSKVCEYVTKGMRKVKKWQVHNYYMEV